MKELDMIKAFAKLEGIDISINLNGEPLYNNGRDDVYNPITDLVLNCKAREKYNVSVVYMGFKSLSDCVSIANDFMVYLTNKEDAPKAVIECILKSEGLWVCQK